MQRSVDPELNSAESATEVVVGDLVDDVHSADVVASVEEVTIPEDTTTSAVERNVEIVDEVPTHRARRGRKRGVILPSLPRKVTRVEEPSGPPAPRTLREMILDTTSGSASASSIQRQTKAKALRVKQNVSDVVDEAPIKKPEPEEEIVSEAPALLGPQVRIVGGRIVLDQSSLTFSAPKTNSSSYSLVDEGVGGENERRLTSASYTKRSGTLKWSTEATDLFYVAISKYGTDFSLVSQLFPNRTRRQIRNKFKAEERANPHRVDAALINRKPIDLGDFNLPVVGDDDVPIESNVCIDDVPIEPKVGADDVPIEPYVVVDDVPIESGVGVGDGSIAPDAVPDESDNMAEVNKDVDDGENDEDDDIEALARHDQPEYFDSDDAGFNEADCEPYDDE